ncbi:putative adenylyltransferase/sulfurtransferase MoeZ [Pseudovibrio axinellae]|uniref:Putative adenylyltransferase/sulfurtransferase MoeZ n=1 Tax=Pseudovibrio axinellae TaxID=989403 RepID=A0A165UPH3_9HYPH|nr:HesA/MoeB/ThiF family protein [Pseudovibrio axinellae]KZL12659.1 putative adenylyltransferase/sulfurtransferase MoeZ [Pseudovibrio axinellae]SEP62606.1 Molybdopterin or thiamine biosynthesis adenylyltransferase [Pseudovibrio axinellae]
MTRYDRQMILPDVGTKGQERLQAAHVLVVGAGGLGCPVMQYLAGAGVGVITIVDPDVVEESNLHRQPLYSLADVGESKAYAAAARLHGYNPEVELRALNVALDPSNASELVAQADVIVDAADTFAASYTLSDECYLQGKPLISASALGTSGYLGGFCGGAPSLRAVFPAPTTNSANCASAGVLGPSVGTIGTLQAQMTLAVLLGFSPNPLGRLVTLDLRSFQFGGFSFASAKEPERYTPFISLQDLHQDDMVIELRDICETPQATCERAVRLLPEDLASHNFSNAKRIVLCCKTGLRAWRSAEILHKKGHTNLALIADTRS